MRSYVCRRAEAYSNPSPSRHALARVTESDACRRLSNLSARSVVSSRTSSFGGVRRLDLKARSADSDRTLDDKGPV